MVIEYKKEKGKELKLSSAAGEFFLFTYGDNMHKFYGNMMSLSRLGIRDSRLGNAQLCPLVATGLRRC